MYAISDAAASGSEDRLGERADVGVVVDVDRQAEPRRELLRDRHPDPAGQDRGGADGAGRLVDRARQADPRAEQPAAVDAGLGEHLVDQSDRSVERVLRVVVDVEGALRLGEDRVAEVGDRDAEQRMVEVQSQDRAGARVEGQEHGRAPLRRSPRPRVRRARRGGPRPSSSLTRVETVERARPVRRAMSARETLPRPRTTSSTSRRLRSRSERKDPGLLLPMSGPFRIPLVLCQASYETIRQTRARSFATRTNRGSAGRFGPRADGDVDGEEQAWRAGAPDPRREHAAARSTRRGEGFRWRACARRRRWSRPGRAPRRPRECCAAGASPWPSLRR